MVLSKSLDEFKVIAALLCDVQTLHSEVFTPRALRLTIKKMESRYTREGKGLLTKTFPRLAKSLDRALTGEVSLDCTGFRKIPGTKLPRFLGELFKRIFTHDGWVLPTPCVTSIKSIRQVLYLFYKYELPFDTDQEHQVLDQFERTDNDLAIHNQACTDSSTCSSASDRCTAGVCPKRAQTVDTDSIVKRARVLLSRLFQSFDLSDIYPRHGPGAVSTKETGARKYQWSQISPRITQTYPLDQYFYTSLGHVCDRYQEIQSLVFS